MKFMHFVLSYAAGKVTSRMPMLPGSLAFATVANLVLKNHVSQELQTQLHGKILRFDVTDLKLDFTIVWVRGGFVASWHREEPDLVMRASAQDFLLLATGREDADSLFFNRRLLMEGDTELGVLLKNTVDQLELDLPALIAAVPVDLLSSLLGRQM